MLDEADLERYSRQLVLPEWSGEAQERLGRSSAIVIGAGALGSPAATYLVGAGVGRVGIVDDDEVELSNLPRQPLHFTPDIGANKAESAAAKLSLINPDVLVEPYPARLDRVNAEMMLSGADVVLDCSDAFATRYVVNDACCALGIPLVEAGVLGFDGLTMTIRPGESACYRCAFPVEPDRTRCRAAARPACLGRWRGSSARSRRWRRSSCSPEWGSRCSTTSSRSTLARSSRRCVSTTRLPDCPACARVPAATQSS